MEEQILKESFTENPESLNTKGVAGNIFSSVSEKIQKGFGEEYLKELLEQFLKKSLVEFS